MILSRSLSVRPRPGAACLVNIKLQIVYPCHGRPLALPGAPAAGWISKGSSTQRLDVRASMGLKENIAILEPIDAIAAVLVTLPDGSSWRIPNAPGKAASARIYAHLAAKHGGKLTASAAQEGLQLYGEYVGEARLQPGSHPNIDLLFRVVEEDLTCGLALQRK